MKPTIIYLLSVIFFEPVMAQPEAPIEVGPFSEQKRFVLNNALQEISGLVAASPTSVFAHNDEHAIIHEINVTDGKTIRAFALGKPTLKGDFEGITQQGDFLYLVTSDGLLYEIRPGEDRQRVAYNIYDTGLAEICEIEGITATGRDGFLLLCKRSVLSREENRLVMYHWRLSERLRPASLWLNVALDNWQDVPQEKPFRGAGLERHPVSGNILIAESKTGGVLEITSTGNYVSYEALELASHPQTEGIAILPNNIVALADEGKKGQLTIYETKR